MVTRAPHGLTAHLPVGEGPRDRAEKGTLRAGHRGGKADAPIVGYTDFAPSRLASGSDVRFPFPFFSPPAFIFTFVAPLSRLLSRSRSSDVLFNFPPSSRRAK